MGVLGGGDAPLGAWAGSLDAGRFPTGAVFYWALGVPGRDDLNYHIGPSECRREAEQVGTPPWVDVRRYRCAVSTRSPGTDKYPALHARRHRWHPPLSPPDMPSLAEQISSGVQADTRDREEDQPVSRFVRCTRTVVNHLKHHVSAPRHHNHARRPRVSSVLVGRRRHRMFCGVL